MCLVPSADAHPELFAGLFRWLLVTSAELWSWQKDSLCGLELQRDRLLTPKQLVFTRLGLLACHPACLWASLLNTACPMHVPGCFLHACLHTCFLLIFLPCFSPLVFFVVCIENILKNNYEKHKKPTKLTSLLLDLTLNFLELKIKPAA